jgi:branched-chain amino acid transport system substrate-binding protein
MGTFPIQEEEHDPIGETADYAFGHDLLKAAKRFMQRTTANSRRTSGCLPTPRLLGVSAQDPRYERTSSSRISPVPTSPTCNVTGIWPLVWDSQVKTASAQKFTDASTKKYGKLPENQAWGDYMSTKTSRRR